MIDERGFFFGQNIRKYSTSRVDFDVFYGTRVALSAETVLSDGAH